MLRNADLGVPGVSIHSWVLSNVDDEEKAADVSGTRHVLCAVPREYDFPWVECVCVCRGVCVCACVHVCACVCVCVCVCMSVVVVGVSSAFLEL